MERDQRSKSRTVKHVCPLGGRTCTCTTASLLAIICIVIGSFLSVNALVQVYDPVEFSTDSAKFSHFVIDERTSNIYIGGKNFIYHLNGDLSLNKEEGTLDTACEGQCDNANKVLVLAADPVDRLITCGSNPTSTRKEASCELRKLTNISEFLPAGDSMINSQTSTVGIIAQEGQNTDFFVGISPQFDPETNLPYVRKWNVDLSKSALSPFNFQTQLGEQTTDAKVVTLQVNFIDGFVQNGFIYFITNQQKLVRNGRTVDPPSDYPFVSKINRVCQTSGNFEAFTEVEMKCTWQGSAYNLVQAVGISQPGRTVAEAVDDDSPMVYAVFAKGDEHTDEPLQDSVLCMYKMSDIEVKFIDTIFKCLSAGSMYGNTHLDFTCPGLSTSVVLDDAEKRKCNGGYFQYPSAIDPLEAEAMVHMEGLLATSIETAVEENETVAFIGTSIGRLLKVHISSPTQGRIYEQVPVDDTRMQQDTYINQTNDQIYMLTEKKLVRMSVANCSQFLTCVDCIGEGGDQDGDPYCGWCTLEARCTRHRDCGNTIEPRRWLPYSAEQCASIVDTSMGFTLPTATPDQEINITVSQLPALTAGSSYSCLFGDYVSEVTSLKGQQVTCTTPPADRIPVIPEGQSHVTVTLSISSSQTSTAFVSADFQFYECSHIASCSQCMNSSIQNSWRCDWCIYSNMCTHDNTTCQQGDTTISSSDANAVGKCPRIETPTTPILIPEGIARPISLKAANLPMEQTKVQGYKCVLTVEGEKQDTAAIVVDETTITCDPAEFTYSAAKRDIEVELDVLWNSRNVIDDDDIKVTLYKCAVDRDSCSRCLSPVSTAPILHCQWCGSVCAVDDSVACTAGNVDVKVQNSSAVCGPPRITKIEPSSGPREGNTTITVTGTDLGQAFTDITRIVVGQAECNLAGMEETYDPGKSVQCRTSANPLGSWTASIMVNGKNGTGQPIYKYVNPVITSFTPSLGPAAGGTQVTVTGKHLNTGSHTTAEFGNAPCVIEGELTNDQVTCRTSSSSDLGNVYLKMYFDGAPRISSQTYQFMANPTITDISRASAIEAGGLLIAVKGTGFDAIQKAAIRTTVAKDGQECTAEEPCQLNNDTSISCTSPPLPSGDRSCTPKAQRKRRATVPDPLATANISFILDGYTINDQDRKLIYYANPAYEKFKGGVKDFSATNIIIKGKNLNAASTKNDVLVMVGNTNATVVSLAPEALVFNPPQNIPGLAAGENNSTKNMRVVTVKHGSLTFRIGHLDYNQHGPESEKTIYIIVSVLGGIIFIIILIIVLICLMSQRRYKKRLKYVQLEMQELETSVKTEATKAFFDIQQDMSGIKDQLQDVGGMPFVTSQDYIRNMLFVGLNLQPPTQDPQLPGENLRQAMMDFSKLLSNKDFLLVFIRSLDEDKKLGMKEKNNIASLLTVALVMEGKLAYLSEVMLTLMSESIINAAESDRYRQLFRRTESIVEKLLANWMSLCMYNYLHKHVASPLYLLYQAIKFQVEKGPIDVITGQCHYSLNYEYLLDEHVEFKEVTLVVENKMQEAETNHVKVLDVDTISQVKNKVLDALLRNKPQSERYGLMDVDLVLRSGFKGQLVLRDTDNTTDKPVPRWAKVNTIGHYGINDNAKVAVINKQDNPNASLATPLDEDTELLPSPTASPKRMPVVYQRSNTKVESDLEEGFQFYHLSPLYEDDASKKKTKGHLGGKSPSSGTQVKHRRIREIYLRRLVTTKKSVQSFVDDVLQVMLSVSSDRPLPKALKYLFDFLDRQADRQRLKTDTKELWKNSCLPLRLWVTALTHPAYVFDMDQKSTVDACISVLTQMLDNACKGIVPKYSFETSPSRVLYASELPNYIDMIPKFYEDIKNLPRVNQEEVDEEFREVCEAFKGTFSSIGTLNQLYNLVTARNDTIIEALDEDEQSLRANMVYKWECIGDTLSQGGD